MQEIKLTQGHVALVDDSDFDVLNKHKWCYANGYAVRNVLINGKQKTIWMHRQILNAPVGLEVDHADGNRSNNQRSNIRLCTRTENMQNRPLTVKNTSGYKGVSFYKPLKKFQARIRISGMEKHLGFFDNVIDAAKAYKSAAITYHKSFAKFVDIG